MSRRLDGGSQGAEVPALPVLERVPSRSARRRIQGAEVAALPPSGAGMSADESLTKAEDLLARLEAARQRLDATEDPEQAIEVLQELRDLAKEVEEELQRARQAAEADAAGA